MARPISKAELIKDLAEESGKSQGDVREVLDALTTVVTRRLVAGDAVALQGLAKFETRDRAARLVRSPATGEMINKPADKAVGVRATTVLKAAVNA